MVFRGKYLDFLLRAFTDRELIFPGQAAQFQTQAGFTGLVARLRQKRWVVYAKPPFGGPDKVLDYLGRYTHRVAISNNRILNVENGGVTFAFRDRAAGDKRDIVTLPAEEFIFSPAVQGVLIASSGPRALHRGPNTSQNPDSSAGLPPPIILQST